MNADILSHLSHTFVIELCLFLLFHVMLLVFCLAPVLYVMLFKCTLQINLSWLKSLGLIQWAQWMSEPNVPQNSKRESSYSDVMLLSLSNNLLIVSLRNSSVVWFIKKVAWADHSTVSALNRTWLYQVSFWDSWKTIKPITVALAATLNQM